MDVYIVLATRYYPGLILGVFSSHALADRYAETKEDSEVQTYRVNYWYENDPNQLQLDLDPHSP